MGSRNSLVRANRTETVSSRFSETPCLPKQELDSGRCLAPTSGCRRNGRLYSIPTCVQDPNLCTQKEKRKEEEVKTNAQGRIRDTVSINLALTFQALGQSCFLSRRLVTTGHVEVLGELPRQVHLPPSNSVWQFPEVSFRLSSSLIMMFSMSFIVK